MAFPQELAIVIQKEMEKLDLKQVKIISDNITNKYRNESGKNRSLINKEIEALVYSAVRMPATYEAVSSVLDQTKKLYSKECKSLLDVGAGTGAATWAACNLSLIHI